MLRSFAPRIFQAYSTVEHRATLVVVDTVGDKVTVALKLKLLIGLRLRE